METPPPAISELKKIMNRYLTHESITKGRVFKPCPDDVILSTAIKSGTTWVQQICHGLRSGGNMDFEEISLVFPYLEAAHDYGYTSLQIEQPYHPRMYKTHFWYDDTPKGAGKYIVVVRKPEDTAVSFYHFFKDWFFQDGEISLDEFVTWIYLKRGAAENFLDTSSQMHHITSWYTHRLDDNVLWLHFEDLKQDTRECVRCIANFLDTGKEDVRLQELVTRQATFEFMMQHRTKFDEHPIKLSRNSVVGLPLDSALNKNTGKLREGKTGFAGAVLSAKSRKLIQKMWKEVVEDEIGFNSYEALRSSVNKELGRSFQT